MGKTLLEAEGLSHEFDEVRILDNVDFSLKAGETVGIQGESGVGKTTLLEILGTMRKPTSGTVMLKDVDVYASSSSRRAEVRGSILGFVFQEGFLLPDLSIWENCRLAVELSSRNWETSKIEKRFKYLLESLGLDPGRREDSPSHLSTGERQRLAVARALMHEPGLLIADEPTGNLDPETSQKLVQLMLPLANEDQTAILIATHDRDLAGEMSTIYSLTDGHIETIDDKSDS